VLGSSIFAANGLTRASRLPLPTTVHSAINEPTLLPPTVRCTNLTHFVPADARQASIGHTASMRYLSQLDAKEEVTCNGLLGQASNFAAAVCRC